MLATMSSQKACPAAPIITALLTSHENNDTLPGSVSEGNIISVAFVHVVGVSLNFQAEIFWR